ncbi:hypothetical protein AB0I84_48580 [Streptomyces spectabilis]|uniref:hypothetical protein n=1 Tax=Streptomyces spectabilis TaxID=68270 RepID=UPI0033CBE1BC
MRPPPGTLGIWPRRARDTRAPYARDPGEFQIPYSWVPEPDLPTGRHTDGPGPGRPTAPRYRATIYPGDAVAHAHARQQCAQRFGTDDLNWTAGTVGRSSWSVDRPVFCYLMERSQSALYGSALSDAPGFTASD